MRLAALFLGITIGFAAGVVSDAAPRSPRSAMGSPAAHHRSALLPAPAEPFDLGRGLFQTPRR
jgi:hypothetical protein